MTPVLARGVAGSVRRRTAAATMAHPASARNPLNVMHAPLSQGFSRKGGASAGKLIHGLEGR